MLGWFSYLFIAIETGSSVPSMVLEEYSVSGIFNLDTILLNKSLKISQILFSLLIISLFSTRVIFSLLTALSEKEGFITFQNNLLSVTELVSKW